MCSSDLSSCGCFGDAIQLTNGETLAKNIVLLLAAVVVVRWPLRMVRFVSKSNQWIVTNYTLLFIIVSSAWSLYTLPPFDFRPYHIGADLRKGMEILHPLPRHHRPDVPLLRSPFRRTKTRRLRLQLYGYRPTQIGRASCRERV